MDIVALKTEKNNAVVVEVKRKRKEFKPELLAGKMKHLKEKVMPQYNMEAVCLPCFNPIVRTALTGSPFFVFENAVK